jgi:hypothetical protein
MTTANAMALRGRRKLLFKRQISNSQNTIAPAGDFPGLCD